MKYTALILFILITLSASHATGEEKQNNYEYASLSVKGLIGGSRSGDDFRWTFPDKSGEMQTVFKVNRDEIANYFSVSEEGEKLIPAIINKIGDMGWKLEAVHHTPSYKENALTTPFFTYYHFVRE